jgi:hypothetical protein
MVEVFMHIAATFQYRRTLQLWQASCNNAEWFSCRMQIKGCDNSCSLLGSVIIPVEFHKALTLAAIILVCSRLL